MLLSIVTRMARALPLRSGYRLADTVSTVHRLLFPARRRAVRGNLQVVAADRDPDRLAASVFRHYGRTLYEFLRGPDVPEIQVRFEGRELLEQALERKRGVVFALIHTGNWEIAGARLARSGIRLNAVAGVQLTRAWTEELRRRQHESGIRILPPGPAAYRGLRARLADNEAVALLFDGNLFRRGVEVPFCGRSVPLPVGPAKLAARSGAALMPAYCVRKPDGSLCVRFLPEVVVPSPARPDLRRATEELADRLGAAVRAHADQWLIFRSFFEERPAATSTMEDAA